MARRTPRPTETPTPRPERPDVDDDAALAARVGEWLRRVALGLTAALLTARAYWPSEPDFKVDAGTGLGWVLAVLAVAGLAVASALVGGTLRVRWSWADAAVVALMFLVGLASSHALDRRVAINLGWEWAALGMMYLLVRNLPRTPGESAALLGGLAATAVAVAVYGLFQVAVELPELRAYYYAHPEHVMQIAGVDAGAAEGLRNRLLGSNEPWSTFALANSLAGFLVGPLVVLLALGWEGLRGREGRGGRLVGLMLAVPPVLVVLGCLILTKSRSAYVGLAVALAVLGWRERRRVPLRTLILTLAGGLVVVGALIAAGVATGRLDRQVITESTYSLRFRGQYWVGAWRVINSSKAAFWSGLGPGNFGDPYVRHKLPEASEEIKDPHDMVLEVWSAGGIWAALALVAALGLGLANLFGPASPAASAVDEDAEPVAPGHPGDGPPRREGWLLACAGGGWVMAMLLGGLNPFVTFDRWLILGVAWPWAVLFGLPLWRRHAIAGAWAGAGALAVMINLLAAGGIGIAGVALALWTLVALGLNLRTDRDCGRQREAGGRLASFGLALIWVALLGSFLGAIGPFWRMEADLAEVDAALAARPPDFDRAEAAAERAWRADRYSARPWLAMANLNYALWQARGSKPDDGHWRRVPVCLLKAVEAPRNPNAWVLHRDRALIMRGLLDRVGSGLSPMELTRYRANIVEGLRNASLLYPSNALLHAQLAEASASIGMTADAVREATEALRLDRLMPHRDRKLPAALVEKLKGMTAEAETPAPESKAGRPTPPR